MKTIVFCMLIAFSALSTPAAVVRGQEHEITVSAAISLKNAFEEIGKAYEVRNKDAKISFNFGASGDLTAQISAGALVDVFASAALKDMDELEKEGLVLQDTRRNFAKNSVVLISPVSSELSLRSFEDLKRTDVKRIAVGNPRSMPIGRYTDDVLQSLKIADAVSNKLVFTENVRQVLDYTARGEVDAGIVYSTDALVRQREVKLVAVAPETSHKPILYPIAMVKGTKHEKTAKSFISFVVFGEGKRILQKYGFKPEQEKIIHYRIGRKEQ